MNLQFKNMSSDSVTDRSILNRLPTNRIWKFRSKKWTIARKPVAKQFKG